MSESERPLDELVRYQVDNGVARITIDRPEAGNALTAAMRDRLAELFEVVSTTLAVRTVLLTGTGKAFCTGADLRGAQAPASPLPGNEPPPGAPERSAGDGARMIRRGWHRLIEVFVRRGILPDAGGCFILPRIVGVQRAKEIMFFGDDVGAATAERIGLVNTVVPGSELEKTAAQWAERLAAGPTKAIALTKWLLNRSLDSDRLTAFQEESWAQEVVTGTEDCKEGRASFAERRPPAFKGW